MRILGIESSCDETAIAVISGNKDILAVEKSVVLSQVKIHAKYGGWYLKWRRGNTSRQFFR